MKSVIASRRRSTFTWFGHLNKSGKAGQLFFLVGLMIIADSRKIDFFPPSPLLWALLSNYLCFGALWPRPNCHKFSDTHLTESRVAKLHQSHLIFLITIPLFQSTYTVLCLYHPALIQSMGNSGPCQARVQTPQSCRWKRGLSVRSHPYCFPRDSCFALTTWEKVESRGQVQTLNAFSECWELISLTITMRSINLHCIHL